jgi:PAS domain S-box-containing protein
LDRRDGQYAELERQNQQLREKLRQLEAYRDRYIDLYDFAPLGYATLDKDGYVQEINLAGARLLGVERDQVIGYAFSDHVAHEDRQALVDHVRQCAGEFRVCTSELRLAVKGGPSVTVQLHSIPVEGPEEEHLCKTAITDITQRKDMEEAIRQSHAFLQTVIDAIPDPLLVVGRDYGILLANRAARKMARGVDPAACLTCYQLSHHRDLPCEGRNEPCPLREVVARKAPMTVTHTHYDAKGNEVFVEISAAPVFDEAGEVTGIIEACRDITDRRRAEEALEQDRTILRTLIDVLPDCVYVKDTEGRFLAANLPTARIMGAATPGDLTGKTDADFYPPDTAARYHADEEQVFRSGEPLVDREEPHLDAGGNPITVLTTKAPLKDRYGKVVGLVGISRVVR